MQSVDAQINAGSFANFDNFFFDLFLGFGNTSSMRAGWMRPSLTKRCKAMRAISRRNGSKQDSIIASGVSSTWNSTPVAASNALILRPSLPIICPLISSFLIWKTEMEFSMECSVAQRWMVSMTTFLACLWALSLASSTISLMEAEDLLRASSTKDSINWDRAWSALRPATFSKACTIF